MIVHRENLDYNEYLEFVLGKHVQALKNPNKKSTNAPRALDCLFLHSNATKKVGVSCYIRLQIT